MFLPVPRTSRVSSPSLTGSPLFGLVTSPINGVEDKELTPVEKKILMARRASPLRPPSSPASPQPQRRLHFNGDAGQSRSASGEPSQLYTSAIDCSH